MNRNNRKKIKITIVTMVLITALMIILPSCGMFGSNQIYYSQYGMPSEDDIIFQKKENGNIVNGADEYEFILNDGKLSFTDFGVKERIGNIEGNVDISEDSVKYVVGLYSMVNDDDMNILLYIEPERKEWFSFFRKIGSPELDFSPEKCVRYEYFELSELVEGTQMPQAKHGLCGEGITESQRLAEFKDVLINGVDIRETINESDITVGYMFGFIEGCGYMAGRMEVVTLSEDNSRYAIKLSDGKVVELDKQWLE